VSRQQLFLELLMSVVLISGGVREIRRNNAGLGIFMVAIPGCFWLSRLLGDLP
jgi:hypothetical protein